MSLFGFFFLSISRSGPAQENHLQEEEQKVTAAEETLKKWDIL